MRVSNNLPGAKHPVSFNIEMDNMIRLIIGCVACKSEDCIWYRKIPPSQPTEWGKGFYLFIYFKE